MTLPPEDQENVDKVIQEAKENVITKPVDIGSFLFLAVTFWVCWIRIQINSTKITTTIALN